jgi:Na+/H+-dicarboxylate symporter
VFFVVVVLAGVAFDGLLDTPLWNELRRDLSIPQVVGLVALPLVFFAAYLGFVKLSQLSGGGTGGIRRYAAAYVYSLVPIAVAYQVAHLLHAPARQGQGSSGTSRTRSGGAGTSSGPPVTASTPA